MNVLKKKLILKFYKNFFKRIYTNYRVTILQYTYYNNNNERLNIYFYKHEKDTISKQYTEIQEGTTAILYIIISIYNIYELISLTHSVSIINNN